ncbi:MAG: ABC transporter permease, partial [Betaproteobacteria bacterium]|nr:ABC transporter permease [Betaproteobacteria bacterium]
FGQSRYAPDGPSQQVINAVMQGVGYVLPRLDDFTRTDWLVYHSGSWATLGPLAAQTLIYLALLTAAALFDLYRRNL